METVEIKTSADLLTQLNEMKSGLEKGMEQKADARFDEKIQAVNKAIEDLKNVKPEVTAAELQQLKSDLDVTIKALDILQVRMKHAPAANAVPEGQKSFNQLLAETFDRHKEEIKNYRKEDGLVSFDMMPEIKATKGKDAREVKAVGDMSIAANFANGTPFTQDVRNNRIEVPYNRVWLSDVIPGGTSNGSSVLYPKENGGEGGAALWTDKATDKPQMDFDLTSQSAYFKWLAGIVIIEREMLDDVDFLLSYLQQKMLVSLKTAENGFILNGSSDTNPVVGLNTAATAYNGTFTRPVDRILDAAWGQLVEDTEDFYNPTNLVLTPRASVAIGLNTAAGSGEYNLPEGSAAFANGQLALGGLQTVKTTQIGAANFMAFDKNAIMFIKRMQPELRMFEDAALAKRNKIMFRIEERATLAIFNNKAIVKGTLVGA